MVEGDEGEMPQRTNKARARVRAGLAYRVAFADKMGTCCGGSRACTCEYQLYQEVIMKVILIENPKLISGLLRKFYGIKKEKQ